MRVLITGITGQDGSYLAEFLLEKGYEVHGIKRRASSFNTQRVDHIYEDPHEKSPSFFLHYGDLTDSSNLTRILQEVQPDEVYNLGAQSHVRVSFDVPEYTGEVVGPGATRLLEELCGEDSVHRAYGGVALPNPASVALHEQLGFVQVATYHEVGYKLGRFWDVSWYERDLST